VGEMDRRQFYKKIMRREKRGAFFTFSEVRKECGAVTKDERQRYWNYWRPLVLQGIVEEQPSGRGRNRYYKVVQSEQLARLTGEAPVRGEAPVNDTLPSTGLNRLARLEVAVEQMEVAVERMERTLDTAVENLEQKMDRLLNVWV